MFLRLIKSALKNKVFWYLASRYFVLGLQFIASIFLAVKLGAYYFGIWSFILLLVNIGSSCNWGIGTAATVLLVQHKEDETLCNQYTFNAFLLVLLTFIPPLLILAYDRIIGIPVFAKYHLGTLIYAVTAIVLLQYVSAFLVNIFRVKNKILEIIIQQTLWPVCMFCLVVLASGKHLLYLLTYSYAAVMLLLVVMFLGYKQVFWKEKRSSPMLKEIASKGFFLFLYNVCFTFIVLSTKLQISYFYSVDEFGYFAFAFALAQGVMLLLDSLIFLLFPKMIDMLKGDDTQKIIAGIDVLRKNYIFPLHLLFYTVLAISPLFFHYLPQYSKSFLPFILILFTLLMYSHCFGYNSYLLAQNKEKEFAGIVFGALILNNILVYCLAASGVKSEYVILGTLITYAIYSVAVNCYALYCLKERNLTIYINKNIPRKKFFIYCATILLTILFAHKRILLILPLLLFVILNIRNIQKIAKNTTELIKNNNLISI